jgi:hypothetical protein
MWAPSTYPDGTPAGGYFLQSGPCRADVWPDARGFRWQVVRDGTVREGRASTLEAAKAAAMHAMLEAGASGVG